MVSSTGRRWAIGVSSWNWLCLAYVGTISAALISYGATGAFALSAVTVMMAVLAGATVVVRPLPLGSVKTVLVVTFGFVALEAWIYIQSLPFPAGMSAAWASLLPLGLAGARSISIQSSDTIYSMQTVALPFLAFILGGLLPRNNREAAILMRAIGVIGGLIVLVSLAQFAMTNDFILSRPKLSYRDSFTAFFVNRNSAGTFIGLSLLVVLRLFWSTSRSLTMHQLLAFSLLGRAAPGRRPTSPIFYAGLFGVLLVGLFMTKSRGAIFATSLSGTVFAYYLLWLRLRSSAPRKAIAPFATAAVGLAVAIVVLFAVLGDRVVLRAETMGSNDPRFCVMPGITRLLLENWQIGTGAGTFEEAFGAYRDPMCGLSGVWEKAHNSYLQAMIELGVGGSAVILVCVFAVLATFAVRIFSLSSSTKRSYAGLGLAALTLVLTHSLVDFSLEIPGVAMYVAAIVGCALTASSPDGGIGLARVHHSAHRIRRDA